MPPAPEVSVIIPTKDRAASAVRAVRSALDQTMQNVEVILVDDGSSDDTTERMNDIRDARLRLIRLSESSGTPAVPRNVAIERSSAARIAFLDDDDEWMPDKLERQLEACDPSAHIWYSRCIREDVSSGKETDFHAVAGIHSLPSGNALAAMVRRNFLPLLTVVVRKDVLMAGGGFDQRFTGQDDYELWLRLLCQRQVTVSPLDAQTARYRWSHDNLSNNIDWGVGQFAIFDELWRLFPERRGVLWPGYRRSLRRMCIRELIDVRDGVRGRIIPAIIDGASAGGRASRYYSMLLRGALTARRAKGFEPAEHDRTRSPGRQA